MGSRPLHIRQEHHIIEHDYTKLATFFATFHTHSQIRGTHMLCTIQPETADVCLTTEGQCIDQTIQSITHYYPFIKVDCYIIMPTHIHLILIFKAQQISTPIKPGTVIGKIKALSTYRARRVGLTNFAWQPNYYDRIIRDPSQLEATRNYIHNNPIRWLQKHQQ